MFRSLFLVSAVIICLSAPLVAFADSHDPKRITPAEVMDKMKAGEDVLFLDTRTPSDWSAGATMIPNAIRITNNEVLTRVAKETSKVRLIVTYCT